MKRRALLSSLGTAGVVAVSGCAGLTGPITHDVGEAFRVRSVRLVVRDVVTKRMLHWIGGNFTKANGEFVIVDVRLTNGRDAELDLSLDEWFTLVDGEGATYRVDGDMTFNTDVELEPGVPQRALLVYDVPTDQIERKIHVADTDHYVRI